MAFVAAGNDTICVSLRTSGYQTQIVIGQIIVKRTIINYFNKRCGGFSSIEVNYKTTNHSFKRTEDEQEYNENLKTILFGESKNNTID